MSLAARRLPFSSWRTMGLRHLTFEVPGLPPSTEDPSANPTRTLFQAVCSLRERAEEAARGREDFPAELGGLGLQLTVFSASREDFGSGAPLLNAVAWGLSARANMSTEEFPQHGSLFTNPSQLRQTSFSWRRATESHYIVRIWPMHD